MRATGPLRSTGPSTRHPVGQFWFNLNASKIVLNSDKSWLCQNSSHSIDQCKRLALLGTETRTKSCKGESCVFQLPKTCGKRPQVHLEFKKAPVSRKVQWRPVPILPSSAVTLSNSADRSNCYLCE